ncbi:TPA_asm: P6 [Artemisia alphacytorhabdovirus 3]|nr:TPA_asm: P6 [Artemisia alphacytorhabdovirus 3]
MAITDLFPDMNAEEYLFEIPGYDMDKKDMIIFALAVGKIILIIITIILCKSRRNKPSKLHMKWI